MEIGPIGSTQEGIVRFGATDRVQQLVEQQHARLLEDRGGQLDAHLTASTSPAYSPSLYAQAAQFQLYTQSGVLASMTAQALGQPVEHSPPASPAVSAVKGIEGSRIDTRA
jgi:hypothetical protein